MDSMPSPEIPREENNNQQEPDLSKRRSVQTIFGGGAVMALSPRKTLLQSPVSQEQEEGEMSIQGTIQEIEQVWGIIIAKDKFSDVADSYMKSDGAYDMARNLGVLGVRRVLEIFPPGFGEMIANNGGSQGADGNVISPMIGFEEDTNPSAMPYLNYIELNPGENQFTTLTHELAHLVHDSSISGIKNVSATGEEYLGPEWKKEEIVGKNFVSRYARHSGEEDFAEVARDLFYRPSLALTHVTNGDSELALKYAMVMEVYSHMTAGLMDKQYFYDLAAGKVDLNYWKTKEPAESFMLNGNDNMIFITDLDKGSPERVPILVMSSTEKSDEDDIDVPSSSNDVDFGMVAGRHVRVLSQVTNGEPEGATYIEVDGFRFPLVDTDAGAITTLYLRTPAIAHTLEIVRGSSGQQTINLRDTTVFNEELLQVRDFNDTNALRLAMEQQGNEKLFLQKLFAGTAIGGALAAGVLYDIGNKREGEISSEQENEGVGTIRSREDRKFSRRTFLKASAVAGIGAATAGATSAGISLAQQDPGLVESLKIKARTMLAFHRYDNIKTEMGAHFMEGQ